MKIKGNDNKFEPCPEYTGRAVCVDVTPLQKKQSQYGERNVFKIVFEVDKEKEDGSRFAVWSTNFTPTLNEKSNFRKFLRSWFGRDLTEQELQEFDTESLLGKPAQLVVIHEHKDGHVFANIAACTPDRSGNPLQPCGRFVRTKERQSTSSQPSPQSGEGEERTATNGYRRTHQPENGAADHAAVKVYAGIELRDLNTEAVQALSEKWLPTAKAYAKPSADDRRLIAALEWWAANEQRAKEVAAAYAEF